MLKSFLQSSHILSSHELSDTHYSSPFNICCNHIKFKISCFLISRMLLPPGVQLLQISMQPISLHLFSSLCHLNKLSFPYTFLYFVSSSQLSSAKYNLQCVCKSYDFICPLQLHIPTNKNNGFAKNIFTSKLSSTANFIDPNEILLSTKQFGKKQKLVTHSGKTFSQHMEDLCLSQSFIFQINTTFRR